LKKILTHKHRFGIFDFEKAISYLLRSSIFCNKTYDKLKLPKTLPKNFQVLNKKVILEGICKGCKPSKGGLN